MSGNTNHKRWLLCVLFVLAAKQTAFAHVMPPDSSDQATIIYVDDDADGLNVGTNWEHAVNSLQDALLLAYFSDKPVEIRVAQGIYTPDRGLGIMPGDRSASFQLINGVTIKGGYAADLSSRRGEPDVRNIDQYKSILSGDLNADDGPELDTVKENNYHVITSSENDSTAILDGCTITGSGIAGGGMDPYNHSSGMYNDKSSPKLVDCTFTGNKATERGAGMYNNDSNPVLFNCTFSENDAPDGGAGMYNNNSSPTLTNCTFSGNAVGGSGAGIYNNNSKPILLNCTFIGNYAGMSGGGMYNEKSVPTLTNCTFINNSAGDDGGAIYSGLSDISLSDCIFEENRAEGDGGGLSHVNGNIQLTGCIFISNRALPPYSTTHSNNQGGAILVSIMSGNQAVATDCLFRNNSAAYGGAIHGNLTALRGCRFTGNVAYYRGGAIDGHETLTCENCLFEGNKAREHVAVVQCLGALLFKNCTIVGNRSPDGYTFLATGGHGAPQDNVFTNCIIRGADPIFRPGRSWLIKTSITYCNIQGGWPGEGNIDLNPYFAQPGYWDPNGTPDDPNDDFWIEGDYHLKSQVGRWEPASQSWLVDDITSPCIDAGDPNSPVAFEPFPNGGIINMGAYGGTAQASKSLIGTSTYTFVPEQSTIIQTGGIAGVNWTYTLTGQFQLTIDFGAGKAWFSNIDAIATDESAADRKLDPNEVFNLTGLTGTIGRDGTIQFTGQADDGSDIILDITLSDESVSFKGQTIPPPNSADFFIFKVDAVAKRKYGGGSGTTEDPYLIYTAEQMNAIGTNSDDWDKHFKLMADIDLNGYTGTDFNIIGNGLFPAFSGSFDGNGHTISNFTYSSTGENFIGIFGYINGPNARICNLGLIDPNVDGRTTADVGSLAGRINLGTVMNCYVIGGSVTGKIVVGGLVGSNAVITDCYAVEVQVTAEGYAGGLVGSSDESIINCYATGSVKGSYRVGGLVGASIGSIVGSYSEGTVAGGSIVGGLVGYNRGSIEGCSSTYSVTGKNSIGGLVGENEGHVVNCYCSCTLDAEDKLGGLTGVNDGIITASYSSAIVQGQNEVGGLVGYNKYHGEIVNCYANGDVTGQSYIGGLVGNNATPNPRAGGIRSGTITNCYSVTLVSGNENVGGLIGYFGEDGVSGSFWDIEASGQTTSDGGAGKTTLEMQTAGTFWDAGWDFVDETDNGTEDIWWIHEGQDYPRLWWELITDGYQ